MPASQANRGHYEAVPALAAQGSVKLVSYNPLLYDQNAGDIEFTLP